MNSRAQKQLVIAFFTLILFVVIGFLFWRVLIFQAPSCRDNIKNQDEVGVDCGGVCPACIGLPQQIILNSADISSVAESGTYNVLFHVENPNAQWGVKTLPYKVIIESNDGRELGSRGGSTFLLPLQKHPVIEQGIITLGSAASLKARVELGEPVWEEIPEKSRDETKSAQLVVINPVLTRLGAGSYFAEARGVIRNDSPFSYDYVIVPVIVTDGRGQVIALRTTEMRTLASGQKREFVAQWRVPFNLQSDSRLEVVALTNVFENENFVRKHGTVEKFQLLKQEPTN